MWLGAIGYIGLGAMLVVVAKCHSGSCG